MSKLGEIWERALVVRRNWYRQAQNINCDNGHTDRLRTEATFLKKEEVVMNLRCVGVDSNTGCDGKYSATVVTKSLII